MTQYPQNNILSNFLSNAYLLTKQMEKHEALSEKTFSECPEYLYGRVHWAKILMDRNDYKQANEVFNNTWDLKKLYPQRKVFHITEVLAFYSTAITYHENMQEESEFLFAFDVLRELDVEEDILLQYSPSVMKWRFL
ncbi:hypothetical protein TYM08_P3617 [Marinicellulosiphila megalodicopiae]